VRLSKSALFDLFESAVRECGWNVLSLPAPTRHPARYRVFRDEAHHTVKLYIWNLTPGGKTRPPDEWRIQPTGVGQFKPEPNGRTLILGWWEGGVFAGFDYEYHKAPLGKSPSIQIKEPELHTAAAKGFAPYNKGSGELPIAFRSDFLATYIDQHDGLHGSGKATAEIGLLEKLSADPASVDDDEIDSTVAAKRRYAITTARRALRDIRFRRRVLSAYEVRCAFCATQLELLDAAHVLPVGHPDSTDEISNGVALCALHHRAYDRSLVAFDQHYKIHLSSDQVGRLKSSNLTGGLKEFQHALLPAVRLPKLIMHRPAPAMVGKANKFRGWSL
jgi:putative restriction endonuclease